MDYIEIARSDYAAFHHLATDYYREGEDANTPQEELDTFIRVLFDKLCSREIHGCFAKIRKDCIGFALWALDTPDFAFSEIPGCGTILEIGLLPAFRSSGHGKALVSFIEDWFCKKNVMQCYVSAYGPAQAFWSRCGYVKNGNTAKNGLPIMAKSLSMQSTGA